MVAALVSLLCALTVLPAWADRLAKADGNDGHGPLDIVRIVHKHRVGHPNLFIHKIVMEKPWTRRAIHSSSQQSRFITVTFDVDPSRGYHCIGCVTEREVLILARHGRIIARLYNHLGDPPRKLASLPVWRPNRRSVAFSVRRRQLSGKHVDHYYWGVKSLYTRSGSSCPRSKPCVDLAPNHRHQMLRQDL